MTVAYETGSASSTADLLTKIAAFAASNGFTVSAVTGGQVFHSGSIVVGVNAAATQINMRGATAFNPANAWNLQTNAPAKTAVMSCVSSGPYVGYFAFCGDEGGQKYLHVVLELTSGKYRHLCFGQLVKSGSYTGGVYVEGVNWSQSTSHINVPDSGLHNTVCDSRSDFTGTNHMYIDYDSKANNFQDITNISSHSTTKCSGNTRSLSMWDSLYKAQNMKWNIRTPLFPLEYFVGRPSALWSPIGRIPNMRYVNLRAIGPEDEIEIGGETWKCFPMVQRQDFAVANTVESSGYYGYAHLMP